MIITMIIIIMIKQKKVHAFNILILTLILEDDYPEYLQFHYIKTFRFYLKK